MTGTAAAADPGPRRNCCGRYRFGSFEVDFESGELRKSGLLIHTQNQPLQVLCILLSRKGEIVTREELRELLWPADTFVDFEHGLNAAINKLREAVGESADNPRFVETLPRRGYRFIAPVEGPVTPVGTLSVVAAVSDRRLRPPTAGGDTDATDGDGDIAATIRSGNSAARDRRGGSRTAPTKTADRSTQCWRSACVAGRIARPERARPARHVAAEARPADARYSVRDFSGRRADPRFSPDGNQLVFSWNGEKEDNWDIYIKQIGEEKPLRLTSDPRLDRFPAANDGTIRNARKLP